MIGLKKYTHQEREDVIQKLLPNIQKKFGSNLLGLAATASFARGDDLDFSDLELTAIVREMPEGKDFEGMGRIINGLLVELIWTTEETYIRFFKRQVHDDWYLAASDRMVPVVNENLIKRLNDHSVEVTAEACLAQLRRHWPEVQESTSKVLKAVQQRDREGLGLVYWDMVRHTLVALSLLNCRPYTTFAKMVAEARAFDVKPSTFDPFVSPLRDGLDDLDALRALVVRTFEEMEGFVLSAGVNPYSEEWQLFDD